jgi:hypothetical protein
MTIESAISAVLLFPVLFATASLQNNEIVANKLVANVYSESSPQTERNYCANSVKNKANSYNHGGWRTF